jgi:hypothetical protein
VKRNFLPLVIFCFFACLNGCAGKMSPKVENSNSPPKTLTEKEFEDVCKGSKVEEAAEYNKTAGTTSPIIVFTQANSGKSDRNDEASKSYRNDVLAVPDDWKTNYTTLAKNQLVACINVVERKEIKRCPFNDKGKKYQLIKYDTKYNVKVFEALTGSLVLEKELNQKADKECLIVEVFFDAEKIEDAPYKKELVELLKPFVKH